MEALKSGALILLSIISLSGILFGAYLGVKFRKDVNYKKYYVLLWLLVVVYIMLFVLTIILI